MSISSTGLNGSATIVNTDLFDDVEALKEQVTTLSTSYWVWVGDKETGDWVWRGVEDELANQFNATMNISTKRRRIDDV